MVRVNIPGGDVRPVVDVNQYEPPSIAGAIITVRPVSSDTCSCTAPR